MKNVSLLLAILLITATQLVFAGNDNKSTTAPAAATCSISGKIVDTSTGEALVGVKVSITGTTQVVYTDFDGNFSCNGLNPGNYNIETSYISYESTTFKNVVIQAEKENTLKMTLNPVEE